jgi:hypothetical protein
MTLPDQTVEPKTLPYVPGYEDEEGVLREVRLVGETWDVHFREGKWSEQIDRQWKVPHPNSFYL